MRQYESYKDSGVEWIGEIPSHWDIINLQYIGKYINGYAFKPSDWSDEGSPIIRIQDLTGTNVNPNYFNGTINDKYHVKKDDILVSWAATLDAFKWYGPDGWLNQHIFKAIPQGIDYSFFFWLLKLAMFHMNNDNKHGIMMEHITLPLFNKFKVPLPSLSEQQAIASYLDEKTSQIDRIIKSREAKIKLLEELKASIISNAVTKGIRKDIETKDSGIEWIGRIPKHWEIHPMKRLALRIGSGKTPLGGAEVYTTKGVMFIRSQNVYNDGLYTDGIAFITEDINSQMLYSEVHHNDVLLNITGGSIGRACLIKDERIKANVNQHVCEIRPNTTLVVPEYLHYTIISNSVQNEIKACQTGGNRDELNFEQIGNFQIFLPQLSEQKEIVDYIQKRLTHISSNIKIVPL